MNLQNIAFGAWLLVKSQLPHLEKRLSLSANYLWKTNEKLEGNNNCIWQNAYYLCCFSVPWVLRYRSQMPGHFRLLHPSWTDWHTWPQSHAGIDPISSCFLICVYEVMIKSAVGGQPIRKHTNPSYKAIKHTFLISDHD